MTKIFSFQLKFFLLERIFGDIFLHNYLDFLETNPIVQYLKFDFESLYDYSLFKNKIVLFSLQFSRSRQMSEVHDQSLCQCSSHHCQGKSRGLIVLRQGLLDWEIFLLLFQNPVAHCWTEEKSIKGKFCNVCRKKMHEVPGIRCEGQLRPVLIVSFNSIHSYLLFPRNLSNIVYVSKQLMINAA